jgi:hypothetical protein
MLALKMRMRADSTLDAAVERINALEKRIKAKFPKSPGASSSPTSPIGMGTFLICC